MDPVAELERLKQVRERACKEDRKNEENSVPAKMAYDLISLVTLQVRTKEELARVQDQIMGASATKLSHE